MKGEYAYARLGKALLDDVKARVVSGDIGEEDQEILELAEKLGAGNVRQVSYDPEKHGPTEWAATGDPIWWWGE